MNRFSHVDFAAPPFPPACGGREKGGDVYACHRQRALRPPLFPPPCGGGRGGDCIVRASTITARSAGARPPFPPPAGGQGGRLHRARVNDHRARRRCAPPLSPSLRGGAGRAIASCARQRSPRAAQARAPPFPPPAGGAGGAQRVVALRGVFGHEGQGGSDEGPLLVAHIAWIGLTCHTEIIPRLKCITGSRRSAWLNHAVVIADRRLQHPEVCHAHHARGVRREARGERHQARDGACEALGAAPG